MLFSSKEIEFGWAKYWAKSTNFLEPAAGFRFEDSPEAYSATSEQVHKTLFSDHKLENQSIFNVDHCPKFSERNTRWSLTKEFLVSGIQCEDQQVLNFIIKLLKAEL